MRIDDTSHPFLERLASEVQEQPDGLLEEPEVSEELLSVDREKMLDRLDLHHQSFIHQQVDAERGRKNLAVEADIHRMLSGDAIPRRRETSCKDCLVHAFQQAWAKLAVDAQRKVENVAADGVDIPHFFSASPRLRVNITAF